MQLIEKKYNLQFYLNINKTLRIELWKYILNILKFDQILFNILIIS